MSRKVLDANVSDADVNSIMDNIIAQNPQLNAQIEQVHNENNLFLCKVLRIYPYEDKAYVSVLNSGEEVFCRLSHEVLGSGMSVDYVPNGVELLDWDNYDGKKYIAPYDDLFGIVGKVRWMNLNDENVLFGYVNVYDNYDLKSDNNKGDISIKSGESIISVDDERINIMTPALYINGLPYDEPNLKNYYDKKETSIIVNTLMDITNEQTIYQNLLNATEDYNTLSNNKYTLFRGDCWTINNNFESSACITSDTTKDFTVTGTFRTKGDLIGIYWNSEDLIQHPYISYGSKKDYSNVVLEFDYEMTGCKDWKDDYSVDNNPCVLTINKTNGTVNYVVMYPFITGNHVVIDFNNLEMNDGNLVNVTNIESIMLLLKPTNHTGEYSIMNNTDFKCKVTNIQVTNGNICNEHMPLEPHNIRLCEGYDDFYNFNPLRIAKEMRKLGYTEWVDLYIGASHYYEKSGTVNDTVDVSGFNHVRTEKMVLNQKTPLNKAFSTWLKYYAKALKKYDVNKLIISVSMENLQCPTSWRQKLSNGMYAQTGWTPSTFFYSPCHDKPLKYMQKVSQACLDIIVKEGFPPILQMGEAWWWWQELYPESIGENESTSTKYPNQPPCFYDDSTKQKYREQFNKEIPVYESSWSKYDDETVKWLNQQLVNYTVNLGEVVKSSRYNNGKYYALFFPPSVMDTERVPEMMQKVNYIKDLYNTNILDVLQLEDYDWVTGESSHHDEVYSLGDELGFSKSNLHYFGGYVQYHKDAVEQWRLIKTAMDKAVQKGFGEVFVWAGTQVRRDCKFIGHDKYELIYNLMKIGN